MDDGRKYIRWFGEIGADDVGIVGGKTASLGEMYRELAPQGVRVPNGFAIVAQAYRDLLREAGAWRPLRDLLSGLNPDDVTDLADRARKARALVYEAGLPQRLQDEILEAYHTLQREYGADLSLAVRSSATAEDLPTASFAGQHESFLNVRGAMALLDACRHCFASLFTDRAITYRSRHGFDHFKVALSIAVMKMVRADLSSCGVMFSLDTETGFPDVVFITGIYGLGENLVQGAVDPDEFYVHKPTFKQGYRAVLRRNLGKKQFKMVYGQGKDALLNLPTPPADQVRYCIDDDDVLTLADYAVKVEEHYSRRAGRRVPMDIEWAKDGVDGRLYIIQARPETVVSQRQTAVMETYTLAGKAAVCLRGRAVGEKIASGRARIIADPKHLQDFQPGEILIADTTSPDWGPIMKTAAAIVTNRGGRTCHAAIVAREMGIPAVVGTQNATEALTDGMTVTVSCADGEVGKIYEGEVPFKVERVDLSRLPRPVTKIMINAGNPSIAFKTSFLPNDGVGLARIEFIIGEQIKIHPMALAHPQRIRDPAIRSEIARSTAGYKSGGDFFVQKLAEGVATIAAAFFPKPVIVRLSDFKTNEYASLLGGRDFEPAEENPMLGFRGASRYAHPAYADGFALECRAMNRVRTQMGFKNVKLMIPFCRRVEEAKKVLAQMARHGLKRGENDLEIYIMCEIPNNVIQVDAFAALFDGFSIGSNDLTQLALGVDRDSEIVAFDFDERDPGVIEMIRLAIEGAHRNHRHIGICGQAPSDFPEVAEYLVKAGIDSMSLNPDAVLKTTLSVLKLEAARPSKPPITGQKAGRVPVVPDF